MEVLSHGEVVPAVQALVHDWSGNASTHPLKQAPVLQTWVSTSGSTQEPPFNGPLEMERVRVWTPGDPHNALLEHALHDPQLDTVQGMGMVNRRPLTLQQQNRSTFEGNPSPLEQVLVLPL